MDQLRADLGMRFDIPDIYYSMHNNKCVLGEMSTSMPNLKTQ